MKMIEPFTNNRIDYIVNLVDPQKTDRVLNIGISNIPEIEMILEKKAKECVTIDLDKNKLTKAKKFLTKTKLIEGDITRSSNLKKGSFDKIIILEVFEHLDKDIETVRLINSLLKKGGKIIMSVPNTSFIHIVNPVKYTQHKRHYTNEMVRNMLERNGFKIDHFNVVESWRLLGNVYVHIFFKYILRKNVQFGAFTRKGDNSYSKQNKNGLDIVARAVKIKDI